MNSTDFLKDMLDNWRRQRNDRIKLQHAYIAIALIGILASGLVSLLNVEIGRKMARISLVAVGVFLLNAVVWALVNSSVVMTTQSTSKPAQRTSSTTKKRS
jgi:dipeptide/tripeptide permease